MKIALAQMNTDQADFDANLKRARSFAANAKFSGADLVLFPEMFLAGFNYAANKKALLEGRNFVSELQELAKEIDICLAGSVPALNTGDGRPSNRMLLINPQGEVILDYDKIHLFGNFNEDKYIKGGEQLKLADTPFGKVGLAVCYDLRFPEMFAKLTEKGAEIILHSSAWPHPRMEHFSILARARAIENQNFFISVNQAGGEHFGLRQINYGGDSCAIDPWGRTLCQCKSDVPDIAFCEIKLDEIQKSRTAISAQKDKKNQFYK